MQENQAASAYQKKALILCILLIIIALVCILWIVLRGNASALQPSVNRDNRNAATSASLYADIYQGGELVQSILLSDVTEAYTFTISDQQGNFNEIQVQPGSIGIISANCPDKLCVHQGFIQDSLLPITCLPNRLVIQIRQQESNKNNITPDIITY